MKKGQIFEGIIERVDFPNKGLVKVEEEGKDARYVTVKNAVPGQKVRFIINKFKKGNAEGRLLEVLENSSLETRKPVCSIFPACGGCMYQTMPYEEQMKMKEGQIRRIMDEAVDGEYLFEGVKASPKEFAYRNKMEFSFGDEYKDGPLALGLHKRDSFHDIVTAKDCKIVNKDYNKILTCVLEHFAERNVKFYHKMRHEGYLRHLVIRRGVKTNQIIMSIVTTSDANGEAAADYNILIDKLCKLDLECELKGVLQIINDGLADVVQSDETRVLYGEDVIYEELLGLRFKISTFSFFQTNSLGAEVLYSKAREYVGSTNDKMIFDLYSGTGTIAQILAPVAKKSCRG